MSESDPLVTVKVNDLVVLTKLNLKKELSDIREKLEKIGKINSSVNSLFSFAKISTTKGEGVHLEVINRDDENKMTLEKIIDTNNNILYLKDSREYFIKKCKLEHGYNKIDNNELKKADNKAFTITITDCKSKIIGERHSVVNPKTKKEDFIEFPKVSLSFKLKPTEEFVTRVRKAVESDNKLQELREIIKDYGEFISEEVILGGLIYFENLSKNKYKLFVGGEKGDYSTFNEKEWSDRLNNLKNWDCIKLKNPISIFQLLPDELRKVVLSSVGVKVIYTYTEDYDYNLNESGKEVKNIPQEVLAKSQNEDSECEIFATFIDVKEKDFFNCRFSHQQGQDPKLIIHCIQKNFKMRKCKLKIIWMIIGYDIKFGLNSSGFNVQLKKFNVPDCSTYMHKRFENFEELESNSLVLCFGIPKLSKLDRSNESLTIGHHFFDDQESKKIGLCIFSYCLKQKRYVNLPEFNFYMFIIKYNSNSRDYGMAPFRNKISNWPKISINRKPKFISLYSSGENKCSPVYLKQKANGVKIKYLKCNIHRPKSLENLQHAYFQANHDGRYYLLF
ncbi:unnamed protein product [Rhizophagus irregularis]|uniref:DUF7431 domain-containing protein n=1 Tax=Rhizophagus irregularis TaxID=588596 RepID=A0A915ZPR7_9GLOM|nr:unnamed protein product [Rhizophagus irregularis]